MTRAQMERAKGKHHLLRAPNIRKQRATFIFETDDFNNQGLFTILLILESLKVKN